MSSSSSALVDLIKNDDYKGLLERCKSIRDIGSANIKILIHKEAGNNNNNQGRDDNQGSLIPDDGLTLLHVAAYYDALDCFRYLQLSRQISLRKKSSHAFLPLHYACWAGASEVALYILTCDPSQASIIVEGTDNLQLIYCSLMGGDAEIIQALFDKGAKLGQNQDKLVEKAIGLHRPDIFEIIYKDYKPRQGSVDTPLVIKAVIDHNPLALEMLYHGKDDIICKSPGKPDQNLIAIICENDRDKKFKKILIEKILKDAKEIELEPSNPNVPGICHWACSYMDLDVARILFKLPGCRINRVENNKTGASRLVNRKDKEMLDMLECLIDNGFQINNTNGGRTQSLLESFVTAIAKNFDAIQLLINKGADINIKHSKQNKTLYQYVMELKKDNETNKKMQKIFKEAYDKQ